MERDNSGKALNALSDKSITRTQRTLDKMSYFWPIAVYVVGFFLATLSIMGAGLDSETNQRTWDRPWVPDITRRDICAMPFYPIFFLLPAIIWPLVLAVLILFLICAGLWLFVGLVLSSATSCCGIPLPHNDKGQADGDGEPPQDLEMGAVGSAEDGDATGGGDDELEHPPSYASLVPREDGDGETDGLLSQGAK